ncbi:hypothetical protein [Rufibacter quisquiliarum]|uniref:Arm DNA-binding domain-containing protein n=1 Tax=Rufibacter quisquiliarum TaxID=1549639 RepID=A0A839GWU9_9BACT|nr:hypothetical protein [Rufibacter quisquiliarum]MBA9078211.1 hypothetical protein [Rufibacter quisquiliarum]
MSYSTKAILLKPDKQGFSRIHIRYTYNRKPSSISIDEKIERVHFDTVKGLVKPKHPDSSEINNKIRTAQAELESVASSLENPEFVQVKEIYEKRVAEKVAAHKRKRLHEKIDYVINISDANDIAKQIAYHQNKLNELIKMQKELALKGFGSNSYEHNQILEYLNEFIKYHADKPVYQKQLKSFSVRFKKFTEKNNIILDYNIFDKDYYNLYCNYLKTEHNATLNYIGSNVKKLKAFLTWINEVKGIEMKKDFKKFKVQTEKKDVIYFTEEELDLIWDYKKECKKEYKKYIDLCVFGNHTGLRISDIRQSTFRIEVVDDEKLLIGRTVKTDGFYQVPLLFDNRIEEILTEHKYNLNLVSDQKYNKYIKQICKEVFAKHNINQEPIIIARKQFGDKEKSSKSFFKHDLLSSHSNRRGFCTRLYKDGWTEYDILNIIGSTSSAILRGYISNITSDIVKKAKSKRLEKLEKAKEKLKRVQA